MRKHKSIAAELRLFDVKGLSTDAKGCILVSGDFVLAFWLGIRAYGAEYIKVGTVNTTSLPVNIHSWDNEWLSLVRSVKGNGSNKRRGSEWQWRQEALSE